MRITVLLLLGTSLICGESNARTWIVNPSGTGDAPTITAGLASAAYGDDVLLEAGTYHESEIYMKDGVRLHGAGDPASVIVDAQGLGTVFRCHFVGSATSIENITITNGLGTAVGGIEITNGSDVVIDNCIIRGNHGTVFAGGVVTSTSGFTDNPTIQNCIITDNEGVLAGGVVFFSGGAGTPDGGSLINCTVSDNKVANIYVGTQTTPTMTHCIISYCPDGKAFKCIADAAPIIECCDVYGNAGGDGLCTGFSGLGNFSSDPLFCDRSGGNYSLYSGSPCLAGRHPSTECESDLIGAQGQACLVDVLPTTWGSLKAKYH